MTRNAAVHRLRLASVKLAGRYNPPTYRDTRIEVYAYLILTGSAAILVDTGVGEGSRYIDEHFDPHIRPVVAQLARLKVAPRDIDVVVNSHLHFDHCGNNALFAEAEVLVQEAELEAARTTAYTISRWFDYEGARLTPIVGDSAVRNDVELIATPGHTPGHQSVLVKSGRRSMLIAAQAAFTADEYRRGGDPKEQAHEGLEEPYAESIQRLKSVGADEVLFSHDAEVVNGGPGRR